MSTMTSDLARAVWNYDPISGVFTWIISPRSDIQAGSVAGAIGIYGYRIIGFKGKKYRAARLAWLWMTGNLPVGEVDHFDLDHQNDKWDNLRDATSTQNKCNTRARVDNATGIKGIFQNKYGTYIAQIGVNGTKKHLGCFKTAEEAKAARDAAAAELHGEFRRAA